MSRTRVVTGSLSAFAIVSVCILLALGAAWLYRAVVMPGDASGKPVRRIEVDGAQALEGRLRAHIDALARDIGPRHHWRSGSLERTVHYITEQLQAYGYVVRDQSFAIAEEHAEFRNIEVELPGTGVPQELLLIGAHYDTVPGSPGADDNASGIAALLELARMLRGSLYERTIRLVAFVNEEEPFAGGDGMGSIVYAREVRAAGADVFGMIALESIAYFRNEPGTQMYPAPLSWCYPDTGNFLAFVGNVSSRGFLRQAITSFRRHAEVPSEGISVPAALAPDISRSDHAAFWREGYPAIMVTDTVPFRNPHYHSKDDLAATLDFRSFTAAVRGLVAMVGDLARRH